MVNWRQTATMSPEMFVRLNPGLDLKDVTALIDEGALRTTTINGKAQIYTESVKELLKEIAPAGEAKVSRRGERLLSAVGVR